MKKDVTFYICIGKTVQFTRSTLKDALIIYKYLLFVGYNATENGGGGGGASILGKFLSTKKPICRHKPNVM